MPSRVSDVNVQPAGQLYLWATYASTKSPVQHCLQRHAVNRCSGKVFVFKTHGSCLVEPCTPLSTHSCHYVKTFTIYNQARPPLMRLSETNGDNCELQHTGNLATKSIQFI